MDNRIWNDKYKPKKISDLLLDVNIRFELTKMLVTRNISNIILNGTPGVGKTSTLLCLMSEYFDNDEKLYKECVFDFNASDDRGIKFVEDTITNICKNKINYNINGKRYYKIIILDEADNITEKAQMLIATLIEKYYDTTRFLLTCNTTVPIIQEIQSLCKIIRYPKPHPDMLGEKLKSILDIEKYKYNNDAIRYIAIISKGDIRQSINMLQLLATRYKKITIKNIDKTFERPKYITIMKLLNYCLEKDMIKSIKLANKLKNKGYTSQEILLSCIDILKDINNSEFKINEQKRIQYCKNIYDSIVNITKSTDTNLLLCNCIINLNNLI